MEKYVRGVQWLREILFNTQFNADRIRVKVNKLLNSLGEYKRSASKIMWLMFNDVMFKKGKTRFLFPIQQDVWLMFNDVTYKKGKTRFLFPIQQDVKFMFNDVMFKKGKTRFLFPIQQDVWLIFNDITYKKVMSSANIIVEHPIPGFGISFVNIA
ncbi:hypothetical protein SK128_010060 [Halocaridina rubra]|uniref:Uncharacterized protein n=1 Tax=Halocaridina rubra TaxID=373956 RepID=A0AAN8ZTD1_HALRR